MANMLCGKCGASLVLVGTRHRCVMPPAIDGTREPVMPEPIHEPMTSTEKLGVKGTTYRYRDADKRRAYMRDYMARRRAV
jgi:hypothetical protein